MLIESAGLCGLNGCDYPQFNIDGNIEFCVSHRNVECIYQVIIGQYLTKIDAKKLVYIIIHYCIESDSCRSKELTTELLQWIPSPVWNAGHPIILLGRTQSLVASWAHACFSLSRNINIGAILAFLDHRWGFPLYISGWSPSSIPSVRSEWDNEALSKVGKANYVARQLEKTARTLLNYEELRRLGNKDEKSRTFRLEQASRRHTRRN